MPTSDSVQLSLGSRWNALPFRGVFNIPFFLLRSTIIKRFVRYLSPVSPLHSLTSFPLVLYKQVVSCIRIRLDGTYRSGVVVELAQVARGGLFE